MINNNNRTSPKDGPPTRLLPLLFGLGFLCHLDRTSLAFASLYLKEDIGLSKAAYGFGAGIFFVTYATFQVPVVRLQNNLGAHIVLPTITLLWGIVATSFYFVNGLASFIILRLLLGITEAGAFPGIWAYLVTLYPEDELGPAYTKVATSTALASVIGAPLAATIIKFTNWRYLFIFEGLPTIVYAIVLFTYLPPHPEACPPQSSSKAPPSNLFSILTDWRVLYLGIVWLFVASSMYGVIFFAPLLIKELLPQQSNIAVIFLSALPFTCAAVTMVIVSELAKDRRHAFAGIPVIVGGVCMLCIQFLPAEVGFIGLVLAASAIWAFHGPFMSWPATFLPQQDASAAFAAINSLGAVGGFGGPVLLGAFADDGVALLVLGTFLIVSGFALFYFPVHSCSALAKDNVEMTPILLQD